MAASETDSDAPVEPRVPRQLADDLQHLYEPRAGVSEDIDRAILAMARRRMGRRRVVLLFVRGLAAAAAILLLIVGVWWQGRNLESPAPPVAVAAHEDVDGNGRVDILDAFALAREVETGQPIEPKWDVTGPGGGDGPADRAEVGRDR